MWATRLLPTVPGELIVDVGMGENDMTHTLKHLLLVNLILACFLPGLSFGQDPVPFISLPLVPDATPPGGGDFTLTVKGTGFLPSSIIYWNGIPLTTQLVNNSQLTARVPAADIASPSTASVTVVNPAPGGTSNVAFFAVTEDVGSSVVFLPGFLVPTGEDTDAIAVGDFNNDRELDIAVANAVSNTLSILLGDGTGNFALASSPTTGEAPSSVAVGDFNGDGNLDIAVTNANSNTVSILLGDGTGKFTLASSPSTGFNPCSVAVGDFNGDGKLDLAVADQEGGASIFLGDGTGNFVLASSLAVKSPIAVAVGDFNGDGKLDVALVSCRSVNCFNRELTGSVAIFLGDGTGNFALASSPVVGHQPRSIAVADFNGDGILDLAVANAGSNNVSILLGDGTGNFGQALTVPTGLQPFAVTVGDFNGDGKLDLAIANLDSDRISVLLGDGTGNFALASAAATGGSPALVTAGDFNSDGKLDLAAANMGSSSILISLQGPTAPTVALSPTAINFPTQLLGTTSSTQSVTLTNIGEMQLALGSISASSNFAAQNNCGSAVGPGASCTIRVSFRPGKIGTITGTVTIVDNASNSPQQVSLSGTGTVVTLLPSSLNFGNQAVGTTSSPQTVTLANNGSRALRISGSGITGTNHAVFAETNNCGSSVPAGGSCTFSVTFSPTHTGFATATLGVADDGGGSPQTVGLSGTGTNNLQ